MEGYEMNKIFMLVVMTLLLAAVPSMAQNPGYGGYGMGPGMMGGYGGYGYGMGPGMMGGYGGYGMGPDMMGGGHGYGMGPGMMGGYGMGPGMMGLGMHHGMMGGYGCGMGLGMMGYYSPEQYEKQFKENQDFLNETKELRKKMHALKFDYAEALRNPETDKKDLERINAEMESIWKLIDEKRKSVFK
jgi:hypothetical protein